MKKVFSMLMTAILVFGALGSTVFADNHSSNEAMVRVLHASPDAPAVDVYVDGNAVVEGAEFKASTDYLKLPAGDHNVEIYAAGTKGEQDPVISKSLTVEAGMAYTVAAINMLENIELKVIQDSMSVTEGKTKVRVGHLSPNAPTVDVGMIDGDAVFSGASFPMVTDYKELDPMTYDLEIRTSDGTQVKDLSGTMLEKNTVYSVFAVGTAENLEVLMLKDYTLMPDSMPQTGMGGTAQDSSSLLPIALSVVLFGAGAMIFYRRRTQEQ
ncbi:DUF4397 domain-containing protein [Pontibacillus yanchengensis]|uniref:Peptidase n=1 Tax=Pontibacillus yanchengensis Y32 TaxID=1385514 RepID=A0A0A2TE85_9BACI|nr:DUF4397 domain-containing protein [Pontibacillus yanchengensis]KGP72366.1 peptidase [Pontibacillus yanchengensis Y32]